MNVKIVSFDVYFFIVHQTFVFNFKKMEEKKVEIYKEEDIEWLVSLFPMYNYDKIRRTYKYFGCDWTGAASELEEKLMESLNIPLPCDKNVYQINEMEKQTINKAFLNFMWSLAKGKYSSWFYTVEISTSIPNVCKVSSIVITIFH